MTTLLAYHNDQKIKRKYLKRVRDHQKADEIISGQYWENGKGCAVGCTIHSGEHDRYQTELGIPKWLAILEDFIFESLPNGEAKAFPAGFLQAIPVGANLQPVKWKFCAFLMRENIERVLTLTMDAAVKENVLAALRKTLAFHEQSILDGCENGAAQSAARSAARSASESAAWGAAWSASESAAWSASESAAVVCYKNELLRLLSDAK